jgi:hypothetical protein
MAIRTASINDRRCNPFAVILGICFQLFIGQSRSAIVKHQSESFAVSNMLGIESKLKLINVFVQVLSGNMMIDTINTAFQQSPKAFVCMILS